MVLHEVENLHESRLFLDQVNDDVTLTNPQGSTRYYGMRVIDKILKTLQNEFPKKIINITINAYDDYSAFVAAKKMGYKDIEYFNRDCPRVTR